MEDSAPSQQSAVPSSMWFSGQLTGREVRRRFWHMSPGLLPFILQIVSHRDPISPILRWIILAVASGLGLRIFMGFRRIQRPEERNGLAAVAGYALSVMVMVLLYPQHLELGLSLLAILAFGDGSATLFGLLIGGPRLPWNRNKSWTGFAAFILVGCAMAGWIYWGESWNPERTDPPVTFAMALRLVAPAVVAAAICESINSRINDNIRVGVVGAVVLMLTHFYRPL